MSGMELFFAKTLLLEKVVGADPAFSCDAAFEQMWDDMISQNPHVTLQECVSVGLIWFAQHGVSSKNLPKGSEVMKESVLKTVEMGEKD